MNPSGRGLVGVRITRENFDSEGSTMTQEDGWFDFMVNGGGAVTIHFRKGNLTLQSRSLFVPWNEVSVRQNTLFIGSRPKQSKSKAPSLSEKEAPHAHTKKWSPLGLFLFLLTISSLTTSSVLKYDFLKAFCCTWMFVFVW